MNTPIAALASERNRAAAGQLHPFAISDRALIHGILRRAWDRETRLVRGLSRRIETEYATIDRIGDDIIRLIGSNLEPDEGELIFLTLSMDGDAYFFSTRVTSRLNRARFEVEIPSILYRGERRARQRSLAARTKVSLEITGGFAADVPVVDASPEGIAVEVSDEVAQRLPEGAIVFIQSEVDRSRSWAVIRNSREGRIGGTKRIGMELSPAPIAEVRSGSEPKIEGTPGERAGRSLTLALGAARVVVDRVLSRFGKAASVADSEIVDIPDRSGRLIRAFVESAGRGPDHIAVVIPPAWGRTKETLMPLAATLLASFKGARRPITVVRFDGINRRGESSRDHDCIAVGHEHDRFRFSQGVEDLVSVVNYLHRAPREAPSATVIVSFSAASIETRRVVAIDPRISGWVSVVGSADLQSMMKAISGGIDYALGAERGVKFGMQEILGVPVNMDIASADAIEHGLTYMADARLDMARIRVPITWIHGRHDAWMDARRVRDALAVGDTSRRKLVEVPTGHMLKSSREAFAVFQLIVREVSAMGTGGTIKPIVPRLLEIERRRRAELRRLHHVSVDLRSFWSDYLLGRDRVIGFELMTLTTAYSAFMATQIRLLQLKEGEYVIDVGAGTGAFAHYLQGTGLRDSLRLIAEVDFVRDGLRRARSRLLGTRNVAFVEANIDLAKDRRFGIPFDRGKSDAVIASLFLSYVEKPDLVLREILDVLRPGGRLVVSTLRRDADMSKLFTEGARELQAKWESELTAWSANINFNSAVRGYMNEASRLLDLEEAGRFTFWDANELRSLLIEQGFEDVQVCESFGDPPQAIIAAARRPAG